MGKVSEAITRFMLNEKVLQRFEKKVVKGEAATVDVFLKKNMEYVVRGKVLRGRGTPILSIRGVAGSAVHTQYRNNERSLSVIPERDGLYRIGVEVRTEEDAREPVTLAVTFSYYLPSFKYVMNSVEILPGELSWYRLISDEPKEGLHETDATVEMENSGHGTMVYDEVSENSKAG